MRQISRAGRCVLYASIFAAGVLTGTLAHTLPSLKRHAVSQPNSDGTANAAAHDARSANPWGILEARRIPLADSADFFPDRAVRLEPARWFFEGFTEVTLSNFLSACELAPSQAIDLLDRSHWQPASNGWSVIPSDAVIQTLSGSSRGQIYNALSRSPQNYSQKFPFRFHPAEFTNVFAGSGLSPEKLDAIRQLAYTNRGSLCFADVQALPAVLSSNEFLNAMFAMYATPTYRLRLRIYPDSDVDALVNYWGKGKLAQRIRPMIESLARLPDREGNTISISYLLPAFARLRLNTFPKAWDEPQVAKEDCFWTSMNFFNEQPDMRFLDGNYVRQILQTDYHIIHDNPVYGDLVTLVGPNGDGRHMCVYIADDFVYTKNGVNELSPWVLMKLSDMLLAFTSSDEQRVVIVRRKEHAPDNGIGPNRSG